MSFKRAGSAKKITMVSGYCSVVAMVIYLSLGPDEPITLAIELRPSTSDQDPSMTIVDQQGSQRTSQPDRGEAMTSRDTDTQVELPDLDSAQVKSQIQTAMQSYAEISKYPPSSQPIVSDEHVNAFINNNEPSSSLPYPFYDLDRPIQLSIRLPQYNYFYGDEIAADVELSNIPPNASVSGHSTLLALDGEVLAQSAFEFSKDEADYKLLQSRFDTAQYDTTDWPLEMNVAARLEVDGKPLFISAPFRINTETATFSSVGFSEPKAEYLQIPVNLDVTLGGYYFVSGILYTAESNRPLVYLETEGMLNQGPGTLSLNAHVHALKKGGDEGPYLLKHVKVERWSDELIPRDVAGKVADYDFVVEGYQFDAFEDIPYEDPLRDERMQLLESLSSL